MSQKRIYLQNGQREWFEGLYSESLTAHFNLYLFRLFSLIILSACTLLLATC